jgi:hypothetical protein
VSTSTLDTTTVRRWKRYPHDRPCALAGLTELPQYWHVKQLKFLANFQTGLTLGKEYGVRELIGRHYLRVANVQDGYLDLNTITEISLPADEACRGWPRQADAHPFLGSRRLTRWLIEQGEMVNRKRGPAVAADHGAGRRSTQGEAQYGGLRASGTVLTT